MTDNGHLCLLERRPNGPCAARCCCVSARTGTSFWTDRSLPPFWVVRQPWKLPSLPKRRQTPILPILSPVSSVFARYGLHPPSGRVEGEERAFGEGGWRLARRSNDPPRKLAKARFRPSRREGEVVVGHSPLRFCVDAPHA